MKQKNQKRDYLTFIYLGRFWSSLFLEISVWSEKMTYLCYKYVMIDQSKRRTFIRPQTLYWFKWRELANTYFETLRWFKIDKRKIQK
jgi:hypothetical protein